jgi:hypothetical protein
MILGMSTATFTTLHVIISIIGILSGVVVLYGFLTGRFLRRINDLFLVSTILTSVTGFIFPVTKLLPSHILGILSLIVLALACFAYYGRHLAGPWLRTYIIAAAFAEYFNVFVLVVQLFKHVPTLQALAPTQSEPPFAIAQLLVLIVSIVLTVLAIRKSKHLPLTQPA